MRNILKSVFLLILVVQFCGISLLLANTSEPFTEGLLLKMQGFGRAGLSSNPVEKSIVLGKWKTPQEGSEIKFGEKSATWEKISVNEDGWFNDNKVRGGYIYCTVQSDKAKTMLLEVNGNDYVYVNGSLRTGNRYGYKAEYGAWEPKFDFVLLPIELKKGKNEFLFFNSRTGRLNAKLHEPKSTAIINTKDNTLPDFLLGEEIDFWGAAVIINAGNKPIESYSLTSQMKNNSAVTSDVPVIQPMSVRKIPFKLQGAPISETGKVEIQLELKDANGNQVTNAVIFADAKEPSSTHKRTFVSKIDGAVQYYAVNPAKENDGSPEALVLSVHGASVAALNQANSYASKTWANIIAPTNRRPYGFNWEDWGRTDGMEVLDIVEKELNADPSRIYLTGHSMGGHGTWHLGGTFPDRFAAIGPSAGWISFWSYRVRQGEEEISPIKDMMQRALSTSKTLDFAENYKQQGVYILHGGGDETVRADQARQMVEHLGEFHKDFSYHEEPGKGHWWDISDEPGADCVDWAPMFDFFARHARPEKERIRQIEFITANPGVSSKNNWLAIEAQTEQLKFSKVNIQVDPGKSRFVGTTDNVAVLSFDLSVLEGTDPVTVNIDSQKVENIARPTDCNRIWLGKENGIWRVVAKPALSQKGPHRYGTFKDAFNNQFVFVYGTKGNKAEDQWAFDKARYDAEHFWYQGNGAVEVVADIDFDPTAHPDRNVILYGNSKTNTAWKALLTNSPVQVSNGKITIGKKTVKGKDLACFFVRPRPGSDVASVGAVSGTGIVGMNLTARRPYLSPGYAYPDLTVFNTEILDDRSKGVITAGFFGLDWSIENGEIIWSEGK
jgi:predicted peptidase